MLSMTFASAADDVQFQRQGGAMIVSHHGVSLPVSLLAPAFVFGNGSTAADLQPVEASGDLAQGEELVASYAPISLNGGQSLEVKLHLAWSPEEGILRKWAEYRISPAAASLILKEIVLDTFESPGGGEIEFLPTPPQSFPGFMNGFFAGIEYPVASTRLAGGKLVLAHRPGLAMDTTDWRMSRKMVLGVAVPGEEKRVFSKYITAHRPTPTGLHFNYNSWWTSSVPFTEGEILGLMDAFAENLTKPYGISFDTFTIDMGWSDPKSLWQISPTLFPQGFTNIQAGAEKMNSRLGLWISPTAYYPGALDANWAREQGYETITVPSWTGDPVRICCLGGPKYATAFRERIVDMAGRFGLGHLKLDGYLLTCTETDHGHQPGAESSEKIAEGGLAAIEAVRAAAPDIWLEATCFGFNPSPWWLFYVNSVIGTFGDDSPPGRVPSPVYRESATSGRDYFNLQGAALMTIPIVAQEVLGVVHQYDQPLLNDAVDVLLRGNAFVPFYVNPKYMNARRWAQLAGLMRWTPANADVLGETRPILPMAWREGRVPHFTPQGAMPREPYGYAHWKDGRGLVLLRNPWIKPVDYRLDLTHDAGAPEGLTGLSVVSLYPEPRLYGAGLAGDGSLDIPLAPYETVVLSIAAGQATDGLISASEAVGGRIVVGENNASLKKVAFTGDTPAYGPDWTAQMTDASGAVEVKLEANVKVTAPRTQLLVLLEGNGKSPQAGYAKMSVNGREVALQTQLSDTGWTATGLPQAESWTFLSGDLDEGDNQISLEALAADTATTVSCWVWARKPGGMDSDYPNALPVPEEIYLDAKPLLEQTATGSLGDPEPRDRPVVRIEGRYLDTLDPVSAVQGWGTLQKNQSVWEKPMTIAGVRYQRGLGTHAVSKIVYDLQGLGYGYFVSSVGADGATNPTIDFEVWVDGVKRWESGPMTSQDAARLVNLDIKGAGTLELRVGDGGNGIAADHADWADARLQAEQATATLHDYVSVDICGMKTEVPTACGS